jgi:hypothetical protein
MLAIRSIWNALLSLQCTKEDGTCAEMEAEIDFRDRVRPEDAVKYKCKLYVA